MKKLFGNALNRQKPSKVFALRAHCMRQNLLPANFFRFRWNEKDGGGNDDMVVWLALNQIDGLKQPEIDFLVARFVDLERLFKNHPHSLKREGFSDGIIRQIKNIDWKEIDAELAWSQKPHQHIVTLADDDYPILLREISSSPLVLFVAGQLSCLNEPQLAIVGSRKPTPSGREIASEFSRDLALAGFIITSGLALGIDGESHQGALRAGKTIAVLGTGLDRIYPSVHYRLAERIQENGALVSEFSFHAPVRKINFPKRNRIISGLSRGVLVVEATIRSGSLITAKFAAEQNRDLFAIPGSIRSQLAKGCHKLIKQGAKLVDSIEDIVEEYDFLKSSIKKEKRQKRKELKIEEKKLLSCIGFEITSVDTIMVRTKFLIQEVSSMLLLLELNGYVKSVPGGYYKI